jgi:uncharacterized protein (DUF433 family)
MTVDEVLADFTHITREESLACFAYAAAVFDVDPRGGSA